MRNFGMGDWQTRREYEEALTSEDLQGDCLCGYVVKGKKRCGGPLFVSGLTAGGDKLLLCRYGCGRITTLQQDTQEQPENPLQDEPAKRRRFHIVSENGKLKRESVPEGHDCPLCWEIIDGGK